MSKRFGTFLVLLLCVTVLAGYTRKDALLQKTGASLVSTLSDQLGLEVAAGSGQWSLLPSPHLTFNNVVIDNANVSSLRVELSKEALYRGNITPRSIQISGGTMSVELLFRLLDLSKALPEDTRLEVSAMKLVDNFNLPMASIDVAAKPKAAGDNHWCLPIKQQYVCINDLPAKEAFNNAWLSSRLTY